MLSVIIPTYNIQGGLLDLLEQVAPIAGELIISDSSSDDVALDIAARSGASIVAGQAGRGGQLARAADFAGAKRAEAAGHYYLFLHADSKLSPQAIDDITAHIKRADPRAGVFKLRLDDKGFWPRQLEFWVAMRTFALSLPYGDQGLLIPRGLYEQVGGYPKWDLFEDVRLVRALGRKNIRRFKSAIITDASKYRRDGYLRRSFKNLGLLIRYACGAKPDQLSKRYK